MTNPTDSELEVLFRTWWSTSYPTPPGNHALMTHLGWARFLMNHQASLRVPPGLKQEALDLLDEFSDSEGLYLNPAAHDIIRRAVEALPGA